MKIRAKMVLFVSLLIGSISVFIFLYFPARTKERIIQSVQTEAHSVSHATAFSIAPALLFGDSETGLATLQLAEKIGDLTYLVVLDARHRLFVAAREDLAKDHFRAANSGPDQTAGEIFRATVPILHDGRQIGTLLAGFSLRPMHAEIQRMRRTIALVSLAVFLAGVVAAFVISALVTRPIAQMAEAAKAITRGNWDRRAPVASRDEAGQLASSFNLMLDRLAGARGALEELNSGLERRVAERTLSLEQEVGERRRGEEALRRANERFALAAAAVNGAIYDWDIENGRIGWTDGLTRVFGYSLKDVPADVHWRQARIHPDDLARVEAQLSQDTRSREDFIAEYRFRASDNSYLHVWDRGRVVRDGRGRAVRIVGLIENVTELKRLEDNLRQAQKMDAIGRLAGGVAHDFNNLLTTILGYSELLMGRLGEGPEREEVGEIQKAGERAARLTQQLLAFSRKQMVEPRVLNLNAIVAETEKMLRRLIGEDVLLETSLDPSLAPIRADRGQLEQVLMNIAVNARDAMERGGRLTIRTSNALVHEQFVRKHPGSSAGHFSMIVMTDTGCGMGEDTLKRIFEPFFTTKGPAKGTGLGMATVYGIVKQSGGYIWIDSEKEKGTTISILFPQVDAGVASTGTGSRALPPLGGPETVMLVEDEDGVRRLVRGVLQSHGYNVLEATDASDALRIAQETESAIDLLLTDVVMPGMSGRELADRLLRDRPETRLLYMSGYTEDTILLHGVRTSGTAFLCKPFPPDLLLRRVREVLDCPQGSASLSGRFPVVQSDSVIASD